jgi:hypothetical protein
MKTMTVKKEAQNNTQANRIIVSIPLSNASIIQCNALPSLMVYVICQKQ